MRLVDSRRSGLSQSATTLIWLFFPCSVLTVGEEEEEEYSMALE